MDEMEILTDEKLKNSTVFVEGESEVIETQNDMY